MDKREKGSDLATMVHRVTAFRVVTHDFSAEYPFEQFNKGDL